MRETEVAGGWECGRITGVKEITAADLRSNLQTPIVGRAPVIGGSAIVLSLPHVHLRQQPSRAPS